MRATQLDQAHHFTAPECAPMFFQRIREVTGGRLRPAAEVSSSPGRGIVWFPARFGPPSPSSRARCHRNAECNGQGCSSCDRPVAGIWSLRRGDGGGRRVTAVAAHGRAYPAAVGPAMAVSVFPRCRRGARAPARVRLASGTRPRHASA